MSDRIVGLWCDNCGECWDGLADMAGTTCEACNNGTLNPSEFVKAGRLL